MTTKQELKDYLANSIESGDDDPDPFDEATEVCTYCDFPIKQTSLSTGNMGHGPYWYVAWVHVKTHQRNCASPYALPSGKFSGLDTIPDEV